MSLSGMKIKRSKESFAYFLYNLRSEKNKVSYSGSIIAPQIFFSEEKIEQYSNFSFELFNEKLVLIEQLKSKIGFTTFLCFYAYYKCLFSPTNIFFITNPRLFRYYTNIIQEINFLLAPILSINMEANYPVKEIIFNDSNGSIKFLSDTTYEFNNYTEKIDIIFFDSAELKNFEKLIYFLESILNGLITEQVIMNFNFKGKDKEISITSKTDIENLKNDFKDKIKNIIIK